MYRDHDFDQPLIELRNITFQFESSPDGSLLAHGTFCPSIEVFEELTDPTQCPWFGFHVVDVTTGEVVFSEAEDVWSKNFSWSPDGSRLYRVSGEGDVAVWETSSWTRVEFVGAEPTGVDSIEHHADGRYLLQTNTDGSFVFLDPATGSEINRINGVLGVELGMVQSSTDGRLMLSMIENGIRLWDVDAGQQIGGTIPNNLDAPRSQSADVIQLATQIDDEIHIWNLDTSTWFDAACEAAGRNMTRAEWEQFGPRDAEYRATCPRYPIEDAA